MSSSVPAGTRADAGAPAGEFGFVPMDKVRFGPGAVASLGTELDRLGATRALIVTGGTLANDTDLVGRLEEALGDRLAGVFSDTRPHVPRDVVIAAARAARACGADALVSFGGGSPIDTAKLVALCLAAGVDDADELDRYRFVTGPDGPAFPEVPVVETPHVVVSTTLSASEYTFWAGSTDTAREVKDAYRAPGLTPRVVILDPELTVATPTTLWGTTGVKALDHAIEIVCSTRPLPFATALARGAIEILASDLVGSAEDCDDIPGRGRCQVAAWMSIFAMPSVAPGLSHALGHQLGAHCGIPHGVTSCLVLPAVMEFNAPVNAARQRMVAESMGLDVAGADDVTAAQEAARAVRTIVAKLGVDTRLRAWGVALDDLEAIGAAAEADHMARTNPRPLHGGQAAAILRSLW